MVLLTSGKFIDSTVLLSNSSWLFNPENPIVGLSATVFLHVSTAAAVLLSAIQCTVLQFL